MKPRRRPAETRRGSIHDRGQNLLEAALNYVADGRSVVPVKNKLPALPKWKAYQYRYASCEELKRWFGSGRTSGLAIVTGAGSNLVVIDIDGDYQAGLDLLRAENVVLPPEDQLVRVASGKGHHLWFEHPGIPISTTVDVLTAAGVKIDVRGDGGYIVSPPSVHENGLHYRFIGDNRTPLNRPGFLGGLIS